MDKPQTTTKSQVGAGEKLYILIGIGVSLAVIGAFAYVFWTMQ